MFDLIRAETLSWSSATFTRCPQLHVAKYYFILIFKILKLKWVAKKKYFQVPGDQIRGRDVRSELIYQLTNYLSYWSHYKATDKLITQKK